MIDMQIGLLYDFYGQFLTNKQREIMHLYYENDYSLSEIAENLQITRQAVHDTIKKSKRILSDYEQLLGLAAKFAGKDLVLTRVSDIAEELKQLLAKKKAPEAEDAYIQEKLEEIQRMIRTLQKAE